MNMTLEDLNKEIERIEGLRDQAFARLSGWSKDHERYIGALDVLRAIRDQFPKPAPEPEKGIEKPESPA